MKTLTLLVLLFGFSFSISHAGSYRWVDENGKVHYTDKLPPKASIYGHSELNKTGMHVKKTQRAKTESEIAEEKRLAKLKLAQAQQAKARRVEDEKLLNTYTSVLELVSIYEKRLETQAVNLRQLRAARAKLVQRLKELKQKRNAARENNKDQVTTFNKFLRSAAESLQYYDNAIEQVLIETVDTRRQYATDKKRLENLLEQSYLEEMKDKGISSRLSLESAS